RSVDQIRFHHRLRQYHRDADGRLIVANQEIAMVKLFLLSLAAVAVLVASEGRAQAQTPLVLEAKIQLGDVRGRIDHMAVDLARRRLFVAELENDSVAVVDLDGRKVMQVITDVKGPQGLA